MTYGLSIHDSDDLEATWRFVDQGLGYSAPQTFALIVDPEGNVEPTIIQIHDDDLAEAERDTGVENFVSALRQVGGPGCGVAVMRARPGASSMTEDDARWCRVLHRHLDRAGLGRFPLYFATDESLGPVPPDVLIDAA